MTQQFTICVGTVGAGIWYSPDSGEHWQKSRMELPFFSEIGDIQVRALAVSPHNPHVIFAGSEIGLHRSEDNGASWKLLDLPMQGSQIWAIGLDPSDRDIIYVGTKPPAVFRSKDGGKRWEKLPIGFAERCPIPIGPPRVTAIVVDPQNHNSVWAGAEVAGVFHSVDGGDTWSEIPKLGGTESGLDIHGIAISTGHPKKILVAIPDGIWSSPDEGKTWSLHGFPFPRQEHPAYTRAVAVNAGNPDVIFVGTGNVVFGDKGGVHRTRDGGRTWEASSLPVEPNSTVYGFATHPADPNTVVTNSLFGYVYVSTDGGDSWRKVPRELSEIRSVAWMPN
jgi:photosystem II stability/assembly factor-like uncharacterized protein